MLEVYLSVAVPVAVFHELSVFNTVEQKLIFVDRMHLYHMIQMCSQGCPPDVMSPTATSCSVKDRLWVDT